MTQLTEKQVTAMQQRHDFWAKKEYEAIENNDADALTNASNGKTKVITEAQASGITLVPWNPPNVNTNEAPSTTTTTKQPRSVKESASVASKAAKKAAEKAAGTVPGQTKTAKAKKAKELRACLDGCGEMVPGNFKMGHDAKLKSLILQIERGELAMSELPEIAQELVTFKKGEIETVKDAKGNVKQKLQTYVVTKAPVRFNGRPEITLTTR